MAKYIIASTRLNDDGSVNSVSHPIEVDSDTINTIKILDKTYILEKHGQWIDTGSGQECSVCGEIQYGYDSYRNYCACCGAKMYGGEK